MRRSTWSATAISRTTGGVGQIYGGISFATGWTAGATLDGSPSLFVFVVDTTADDAVHGFAGSFPSVNSAGAGTNIFVWGPGNGVANGFTGSANGGFFLGGDGDYGRAPVSQSIGGLTVGRQYQLSFEWAQSQFTDATGLTTSGWGITFDSETASTGTPALASQGFSGWMAFSHTFTASSVTQTLQFLSSGGPVGLPPFVLLDGVSLTEVSPVPEQATWALMACGLAALCLLGRRSRRGAAAAPAAHGQA